MKCTVVGAARSGLAAAELLQSRGARVFVTDSGSGGPVQAAGERLSALGIPFESGGHTARAADADLVVVSPGVPPDNSVLAEARARGIKVVGELELASWFCAGPIVAITGTNGKTTTTTLLGRMLEDAKKKHVVAGNIGTSFSSVVLGLDQTSPAVLEVSSFQLEHIESFRPRVAVILNITPDHLDRYGGSFRRYGDAKCRIGENQAEGDCLVVNSDDEELRRRTGGLARNGVRLLSFSIGRQPGDGSHAERGVLTLREAGRDTPVVETEAISIRGTHNLYNAMAATLCGRLMGVGIPSMRATLRNFKGVEHRLEFVRELHGVVYINDSKATNVDSVRYALSAYPEPIVLLLGGRDKGNDYSALLDLVPGHVRRIVAIGESAGKVIGAFSGIVQVEAAAGMQEAVAVAARDARPGDVVMLSPACASFDWFENYEHRGRVFKECVGKLQ